jgi:hypothetical protein
LFLSYVFPHIVPSVVNASPEQEVLATSGLSVNQTNFVQMPESAFLLLIIHCLVLHVPTKISQKKLISAELASTVSSTVVSSVEPAKRILYWVSFGNFSFFLSSFCSFADLFSRTVVAQFFCTTRF